LISCSSSQEDTELLVNIEDEENVEEENNEDVNIEDNVEDNAENNIDDEMNAENINEDIEDINEEIEDEPENNDDMQGILKEVLKKEDEKEEKSEQSVAEPSKELEEKPAEDIETEIVEDKIDSEVEKESFHKVTINVDQDFEYDVKSKLNLMNYISFFNLGEFNSKLTFYTKRMANIEVLYQREKDLIIKFKHCVVDSRLTRPLDTSEFKSVIDFVRIEQFYLPTKNVVIRIKLNKPSIINITQKQNEIYFQSRLDPFLNFFSAEG